jgi:uncharacterized protein
MSKIALLGATGSLGRHLLQQALAARHQVTVIVRSPAKLPAEWRAQVTVHQADLSTLPVAELSSMLAGHAAVINTAGLVTEGQAFVDVVDRVVTSLEALPSGDPPCCWFMAGAGLLDLDDAGRRGVDLPGIDATYWPHRVNFERIRRSRLDWRVLCPGPMVEQPPLGLARLRISMDRLPVAMPRLAGAVPGPLLLPLFAYRVPEMIVPYADAAALMLANLAPGIGMSHHRVGLALPVGLRGRKDTWAAKSGAARA